MNFRRLTLALSLCALGFATGCSEKAQEETKDVTQKIEDKAQDVADQIAEKSKQVVSATGEAITDGWITTKIAAKFADDKLLKDADIDVDTKDRVVTLKGTVATQAAKIQAVMIARGTEGVGNVVDELAVKAK